MGGLYKKEILIRPSSGVSIPAALTFTENWLNSFYTSVNNTNGDNFFADVFDPRGEYVRLIRVFHTHCKVTYGLTDDELVFNIIGTSDDPGLDDSHLGGSDDFILMDDPNFIQAYDNINTLMTISDNGILSTVDVVEAINTLSNKLVLLESQLNDPADVIDPIELDNTTIYET